MPRAVGIFVLGECCGLLELDAHIRGAALLLFLALCLLTAEQDSSRRRKQTPKHGSDRGLENNRPLSFLLVFAAVLFACGFLRAASVSRACTAPEKEAFFSRYGIRNEGEFDYGLYLKGLSVSSKEALTEYQNGGLLASGLPYFSQLGRLKARCTEVIEKVYDETDAGIFRALLLGDKSEMDEGVRSLYQSQGIAHLLAVSGLHIGILGMGVYQLLRFFGMGLTGAGLLSSGFVLSYGFLVGAQGSAMRAVIMLLARFLSLRLGRSYDTLSALSLAAFLLLFKSPYLLLQSGFQLSFGAILGISLLGETLIYAAELEQENEKDERRSTLETHSSNRGMHTGVFCGKSVSGREKLKKETSGGAPEGQAFRLRVADRHRLSGLWKTVIISLSIQLFTLPVILYHFYTFPLYGIFLNFIVIPLMSFVLYSGLLSLCLGLLGTALPGCPVLMTLARGAGGAGHYILSFYETLCEISAEIPGSVLVFGRPETWKIGVYYALMLLLFAGLFLPAARKRHICGHPVQAKLYALRPKLRLMIYFAMLICCAQLFRKPLPEHLVIKAIDVGQGDGFLLRFRDRNVLIDGGSSSEDELGKYTLKPFLLSQGISELSAAVVSHGDKDHMSGLLYLLSDVPEIKVKSLLLPAAAKEGENYTELKEAYRAAGGEVLHCLSAGDMLRLSPEITLTCLYGGRARAENTNAHSSYLLLRFGAFSMLFTGDAEKGDEALFAKAVRGTGTEDVPFPEAAADALAGLVPASYTGFNHAESGQEEMRLTVFKAAHHGSKTSNSDAILKLFQPRYALISYGENNAYGHPHQEVLERFSRYGTELLETAKSGEIILETDGKKLWIETFLETKEGKAGFRN